MRVYGNPAESEKKEPTTRSTKWHRGETSKYTLKQHTVSFIRPADEAPPAKTMKPPTPLLTVVSIAIIISLSSLPSSSSWQILTSHNFTSQIQLHPHILLLLTLPCN